MYNPSSVKTCNMRTTVVCQDIDRSALSHKMVKITSTGLDCYYF